MSKVLTASADWWSQFDYPRIETMKFQRLAEAFFERDDDEDFDHSVHASLLQARHDLEYLESKADKNAELIVTLLKDMGAILVMDSAKDITDWCDKHDLSSYSVYTLDSGCAVTFTEQIESDFFKLYLNHQ